MLIQPDTLNRCWQNLNWKWIIWNESSHLQWPFGLVALPMMWDRILCFLGLVIVSRVFISICASKNILEEHLGREHTENLSKIQHRLQKVSQGKILMIIFKRRFDQRKLSFKKTYAWSLCMCLVLCWLLCCLTWRFSCLTSRVSYLRGRFKLLTSRFSFCKIFSLPKRLWTSHPLMGLLWTRQRSKMLVRIDPHRLPLFKYCWKLHRGGFLLWSSSVATETADL